VGSSAPHGGSDPEKWPERDRILQLFEKISGKLPILLQLLAAPSFYFK
jgi:hypothetical protein